jgi:mRNA interferase MazF
MYDYLMSKDFKSWHVLKEQIDSEMAGRSLYCKPKELWMCNLGLNIGSEQNGGGERFSRPILIFKVFNKEIFWGIPITSQSQENDFHYKFNLGGIDQFVKLQQLRLLSVKRLERKITSLPDIEFNGLTTSLLKLFRSQQNEIPLMGEISEAEAKVS